MYEFHRVRWQKNSSFAILGLSVGLWELQMCYLCGGFSLLFLFQLTTYFAFSHIGYNSFYPS